MRSIKKIVTNFLIIAAFAWIFWLIVRDWPVIKGIFSQLSPGNVAWIAASIGLAMVSMLVQVWGLRIFLFQNTGKVFPFICISSHFFAGQIVRYIPGRFFGIYYLAQKMKNIVPAPALVRSNMELLLFSMLLHSFVATALLLYLSIPIGSLLLFAAFGVLFLIIYLRTQCLDFALRLLTPVLPVKVKKILESVASQKKLSYATIMELIVCYLISWALYIPAWVMLTKAFVMFDVTQMIRVCGVYTLSWVIGFLSMLTPGGVGVREALFIYLGQPIISDSQAAFLSIFLRFWLIIIDVFLGLIFLFLGKNYIKGAETMSNVKKNIDYDQNGLNILDPKDILGKKSEYITLLQSKAIDRYLPAGDSTKTAVDLGCGYGRLTPFIARKGWRVIGIDPDPALIQAARQEHPSLEFKVGGLPDLPVDNGQIDLLVMHNLFRPLHLMKQLGLLSGFEKYMSPQGELYVVDNIWVGNPKYVAERALINIIETQGFQLEATIPIRAGRWWLTYLIWAGLINKKFFDNIAERELARMRAKGNRRSSWQYYNVIFKFRRVS